ncbi:hypothetical protein BT93_B2083 [Corymbia citriodora subsp. variegata]|nr:hypothetical protein BT93_B2083 [Corymbia citriodora subsp. variegata]
MATPQRIALLMFVLVFIGNLKKGDPNMSATFESCNQATYDASDPFAYSLAYVLLALETVTPIYPGYDYYIASPYPEAVAYGRAFCNQGLSYPDWHVHQLHESTSACSFGVRWVLQDCSMRYEQYPFSD